MNALREQQEGFARCVIDGVDENYAQTICDAGLSGARRLGIYQHGVAISFRDALGGVYEVVKKLVGDEYFAHVAENYVRTHPSASGNIHDFGESFPEYLESVLELESLPYLPDVARLEWAYHSAFHSPVGEMLNISKLALVPESQHDRLTLFLSPVCFLLHSDFPVLRIWQVNQEAAFIGGGNGEGNSDSSDDDLIDLNEGGVELAIVREGKQIAFHSLSPGAFALLDAISSGETFNVSCEAALKADADCDVSQVLQDAVMNRIVVSFTVS